MYILHLALKTTRGWYFTHTPPRPQWGVRFEFWHAGSHCWRNHPRGPRQIFINRCRGFGVLTPRNFAISIGLAGRSYNSVSTAVLHCDDNINAPAKLRDSKVHSLSTHGVKIKTLSSDVNTFNKGPLLNMSRTSSPDIYWIQKIAKLQNLLTLRPYHRELCRQNKLLNQHLCKVHILLSLSMPHPVFYAIFSILLLFLLSQHWTGGNFMLNAEMHAT